jgi:hypothetical protein
MSALTRLLKAIRVGLNGTLTLEPENGQPVIIKNMLRLLEGVQFADGTTQASASVGAILTHVSNATINSSTTIFGGFGSSTYNAVENVRRIALPVKGKLRRLTLLTGYSFSQPGDGNLVITARVNNADTALVVTVPAGYTSGPNGDIFVDVEHEVAVEAGDRLGLKVVNQATSSSIVIQAVTIVVG